MSVPRLPDAVSELTRLTELCALVDLECRHVSDRLREILAGRERIEPMRISFGPAGGSICVMGLGAYLNNDIQDLASHALPLLGYLGLNSSHEGLIKGLCSTRSETSGPEGLPSAPRTDLMLAGLVHIEGKAPPPGDITTIPGNLFRINVLLTLLERFREATVSLSERISRRLHPPHYRDRVRVDTAKGRVGLDGVWYDVTVDQAILFKHLAEANGETVSGPTIAKREGMREFKTSRIVEQLCRKHPEMEELIVKQSDKVNSPYRLLLRPIE